MKHPKYYLILLIGWLAIIYPHHISAVNGLKYVLVNGKLLDPEIADLTINSKDRITFIFSEELGNCYYQYDLRGRDDSLKTTQKAIKSYRKLAIGQYEFTSSIVLNNEIHPNPTFKFAVKAGFWDQYWMLPLFAVSVLLLFAFLGFVIWLNRTRSKELLSDLRTDWTNKLHNDVGADLSSVSLRLNILKRKLEDVDEAVLLSVSKTYKVLSDIQKKIRFVFDLVDEKKNSLEVMLNDIIDYGRENFQLKGVTLRVLNELDHEYDIKFDIRRVNKLYLAMKEVINNSIKHSQANNAKISIQKIYRGIMITVEDDGIGFDASEKAKGNGIENLKAFANEGLIDLEIKSKPNHGTKIIMKVSKL